MSMQRCILKISLLSILLLGNNIVLLGMKRESDTTVTIYQQPRISFPVEIMIRVVAEGSGQVKNRLKETCGYFSKTFTKDNLAFISHPFFTAHKKDIEDMVCSAAWFNDVQKEQALARHNVKVIDFVMTFKHNSCKTCLITPLAVNWIRSLRNKYNDSKDICFVLEPAIYCAVRCNDLEAVNNIAPRIKDKKSVQKFGDVHVMGLHKCLLMQIIQKDREELFKIVVTNDPLCALNLYPNLTVYQRYFLDVASVSAHQHPFLDVLINSKDISQDLKDKYSRIYRECGGKTKDELEKEKQENCIIS